MSNVTLVAHSVPVEGLAVETIGEFIAYCARVSNPENQSNTETSDKLLKYLERNNHWSPFEMANVCLEIHCPRDISRQILRHRSFSFQEFSQRYAEATEFTVREARVQDTKNRQNSIDNVPEETKLLWEDFQQDIIQRSKDYYRWALKNGIAKECARVVLPEGNTMTTLYMNGTIRSWLHYIALRAENGTQKEHRDIAIECEKIIMGLLKK